MKLYIPTCTLNFNNILATESISPAGFYNRRGFGNKRYYKVQANDFNNVIMLYSKFPQYQVENGDIENGAMVIEIDTDNCPCISLEKLMEKENVEVYTSVSTIYLTPYNCSFYFDSYQDLQNAITKAEQSLENKFYNLYSPILKVRQNKPRSLTDMFSEKDYFDWNSSFCKNVESITTGDSQKDLLVDRLKGMLVCYTIGANISISPEVGRLKQLSRKIRNILSAIVNSPDQKPTDLQDDTLLRYIKEFNEIYSKLDGNATYNAELIEKSLYSPSTNLSKEQIRQVLSDLGLTDEFKKKLNLRPVYNANDVYNCMYASSMSDSYLAEINRMNDSIKKIELDERSKRTPKYLSDLVSVEKEKVKINDPIAGTGAFFPALLESQMKGDYKQFMEQKGLEEQLAVAFVGGAKLKSLMSDKWEGSEYQKYVNDLLGNLQKGTAFNIFAIDNKIMQSFAAFCQKGEDIDRLKDYMLQMGLGDYQFAFAIYGATRGFASLPKTFTSKLIRANDYYSTFIKELCKYVFDFEIIGGELPKQKENREFDAFSNEISSTIISKINQIEPKQKNQTKVVEAVAKAADLENQVRSPKAFMYIADNILGKRANAYKALKNAKFENDESSYTEEQFREKIFSIIKPTLPRSAASRKEIFDKIHKIIELEAKRQDYDAFIYILDNYMKRTDAAYKKIVKLVSLSANLKSEQSKLDFQKDNAENTSSLNLPQIKTFMSLPNKIQYRLSQNWRYTERTYPHDRIEHIRFFLNLCKKEGSGRSNKPTRLLGVFTEELASQAEKELYSFYDIGKDNNHE